jgi:hypothetical protein
MLEKLTFLPARGATKKLFNILLLRLDHILEAQRS